MKIEIEIPDEQYCLDLLEEIHCVCYDEKFSECRLFNKNIECITYDDKETLLYNSRAYKCEECLERS